MGHSKHERSGHVAYALHDEAQRALERALQLPVMHRKERLIELTRKYPSHGPTWLAMAEDHAVGGRNEEAAAALRRALSADLSLRSDVSHGLRIAAPKVLDEAVAMAMQAEKAEKAAASAAPQPVGHVIDRSGTDPQARAALEQAMKLSADRRSDHLAELALRYPGHAPIWLALAEEHLASSRVEYAVSAYERALSLDAALQAVAPRKLEALRLYHRRVRIDAPGKMERSVPASPWMNARNAAPAPSPAPRSKAKGTTPPPMASWDPSRGAAPVPGISDSSLHQVLARALELPDRDQRLAALRTLETKAPDAPAVLFHLALELALAGQNEGARQAGDRLMKVSPAYYRRLYEVAERHWPAADQGRLVGVAAKTMEATKMIELPAQVVNVQPQPQMLPPQMPQPQMLPPQRTRRMPGLGAQPDAGQPAPMAQAYATALLVLPPPQQQRAQIPMRTIVFLTVGVFMGVLLVVLLNWLLPR
jgi:tetratricopeptide (TPR) repeat protein